MLMIPLEPLNESAQMSADFFVPLLSVILLLLLVPVAVPELAA